jgi:predicted nucleotidyltransferase
VQAFDSVEQFLTLITEWAKQQSEITEVILVGSHATEKATSDSDIDLIILCKNPNNYLEETNWIEQFGAVKNTAIEDWGKLTSLRVWYAAGLEIEFGLAGQDWIEKPIDEGTRKVLQNGYETLLDRTGRLARLDE